MGYWVMTMSHSRLELGVEILKVITKVYITNSRRSICIEFINLITLLIIVVMDGGGGVP